MSKTQTFCPLYFAMQARFYLFHLHEVVSFNALRSFCLLEFSLPRSSCFNLLKEEVVPSLCFSFISLFCIPAVIHIFSVMLFTILQSFLCSNSMDPAYLNAMLVLQSLRSNIPIKHHLRTSVYWLFPKLVLATRSFLHISVYNTEL